VTAKSLKHRFVSSIADGTDTTLTRPSNWNDDHDLWLGYRLVTTTTDTLTNADHLSIITYNSGSAVAVSLAAPSGGNFPLGWRVRLRNLGAGVVTVSGTGGATIITTGNTGVASATINPNDTLDIHSNGTSTFIGVPMPQQPSGPYLRSDTTAALAAGYTAISSNGGTITGANQTYTPTPSNTVQNLQFITLNGSSLTGTFTFAPPGSDCTVIVDVINGGSGAVAASLVTSGYTKVTGDAWNGTNGSVFRFFASRIGTRSLLQIQAMQ
jgi:hypothetical protein